MRYVILKPKDETYDPSQTRYESSDDLMAFLTPIADLGAEGPAAEYVRAILPDATAMVVPVHIGSGSSLFLGLITDVDARRQVNLDKHLPFVLLVRAISDQRDSAMTRKKPFDQRLWSLRPMRPDLGKTYPVEVRSSDAGAPVFTEARVGFYNGRLVVYVEAEGVRFSIGFQDLGLELKESEAPASVAVDGSSELDRIGAEST
jgi:hypothetical protein